MNPVEMFIDMQERIETLKTTLDILIIKNGGATITKEEFENYKKGTKRVSASDGPDKSIVFTVEEAEVEA